MPNRAMNMVNGQLTPNNVYSPAILTALSSVSREEYVPESFASVAYIDEDIPLGNGRYVMEPLLLGRMLEVANPSCESSVLTIGSTLGYSCAVLSQLCHKVVAVEEQRELAEKARQRMNIKQYSNVEIIVAALTAGCPAQAPYDYIFIEGAVDIIPDTLFEQLKEGGELLVVKRVHNPLTSLSGLGKLILCRRLGEMIQTREICDAATPVLPGFTQGSAFAL